MPIDYSNGKIYKIVDNTTDMIYIGSTCQTLAQRLGKHRAHYKHWLKTGKLYCSAFKILQNNDYDIILIEEFKCENKDQLHKQERLYIVSTTCVNINIPSRTEQEQKMDWHYNNIEHVQKQRKIYYDKNREQLKSYFIEYKSINGDKMREQQSTYRKENNTEIKLRNKAYYEANKEKFNKKIICECGAEITANYKSIHIKSAKHLSKVFV